MSRKLIDLGPDQSSSLAALAERTGKSQAEIMREGFRLFRVADEAARCGFRMGVIAGERIVREVTGPWDDARPVG